MLKGHSERHESVGGREQQISRFYWFVKRNSKHLCLQGHSSLPYMTLKPLRTASSSTFHHIGCAINVHTIIKSGLIFGGQNLSNRHAVFFLLVDPMEKNHKDPDTIDLNAPRLEQYMHKAWKKHQNTVCWVDKICSKERTIKHDRTQSSFTTHSQPIASRRLSANLTTTCFCSKTASDTHTVSAPCAWYKKDNTTNDPLSRCKSVQQFGYRWDWRSQNTVWLQVQKWIWKTRRKEIHIWYCGWNRATGRTTPMTTRPPRPRAPSTQRTWTSTREWCTRDPMCAQSSSQFLVVMNCTQHRGSSLTCTRHFMSLHEVSVAPRLWALHKFHPTSCFFSFIFNLLHFLSYFVRKKMESFDDS